MIELSGGKSYNLFCDFARSAAGPWERDWFERFSVDGEIRNAAKTIVWTRTFWCVFGKKTESFQNAAFRKHISAFGRPAGAIGADYMAN